MTETNSQRKLNGILGQKPSDDCQMEGDYTSHHGFRVYDMWLYSVVQNEGLKHL